ARLTRRFQRAKAGFALDPESRRLAGRYFVARIGIPLEAEEGVVPDDGEYPPARLAEITWQEPGAPRCARVSAHRPVGIVTADFDSWRPDRPASFDLVLAASSWHWLDPTVSYR